MSAFSQSSLRGKSCVQIIAIGLPKEVLQLMYRLHRRGLEMPLWSPPQPIPDTEEVVHVYIQNAGQNSRGTIQNLRPFFTTKMWVKELG